jgi:hypothetical protein
LGKYSQRRGALGETVEDAMTRVEQWRWPSLISPRKSSLRLRVRRVPAAQAPLPLADPVDDEAAGPGDEEQRRDFQDTLPLVFHLGGDVDPQATEA